MARPMSAPPDVAAAGAAPPAIVEAGDIEYIDESRRYGDPRNQFTIRFSPVIYLAPIFLGGAAIPLGLGVTGSITAIVCANVLGGIGAALCASMGPKLGMPQLVMSRASFGYHGNYVPAALASVLFVGYSAVGTTVGAKAMETLWGLPFIPLAIAVAVLSVVLAVFGYDVLHLSGRWVTLVGVVLLVVVTILALAHGTGTAATATATGSAYWTAWLLEFTIVFSFSVSWMLYASDYSRYLPATTPIRRTAGYAFSGLFIGSTWMMILGVLLISITPKDGALPGMKAVLPAGLLWAVLITLTITSVTHNAVNLYSCSMSSRAWDFPASRTSAVLLAGVLAAALAVALGKTNFQTHFNSFLILMSYFMLPWLALRLLDFFWLAPRRRVSPEVFYRATGPWRGVNWRGMGAFLAGIVVSVPFMSSEIYEGPIAHRLGGADVSYFVGFLVAGAVYALVARPRQRRVGSAMPGERSTAV